MSVLSVRFRYYCIASQIFAASRHLSGTDTAQSGHRHYGPARGSQSHSNIRFGKGDVRRELDEEKQSDRHKVLQLMSALGFLCPKLGEVQVGLGE